MFETFETCSAWTPTWRRGLEREDARREEEEDAILEAGRAAN